jgi:hypothetical protein
MLSILGFLTGLAGPISTIVGKLADTKMALAKVQSDEERNKLLAAIEEMHAQQAVLVAEAGSRLNAIIRGLMAVPVMIVLWKLLAWDKVVGSFVGCSGITKAGTCGIFLTDPLGDDLWKVVAAVIAFYFLYDIAARFRK